MNINLDHTYDEFLKDHAAEAAEAIPRYLKKLERSHFRYGRYVIPTFYKPFLISPPQRNLLKRIAKTFSQVMNTAIRLYFEEGHLAYIFRMNPEAARLIKIDPGYSQSVIFSRYDALVEGESIKLVEFNCETPAGAGYTDEVEKILLGEELLKDFVDEYHLQATDRAQGVLDGLLGAYEEFGGFESPVIAIVDWRDVRAKPEFEYLQQYFESKGYKTVICDPRELKFKGGKLYFKNTHIRLILRRVVFDELLERLDEVEDFIKACETQAVCVVNPLRSRLASTKALLSILTNPQYDHYFTDAENKAKREFLPWTRRLIDAEDFYGHNKIYLIDFLKDEKETLVLKPSYGDGGKDVTIGRETPENVWNETIDKALKGDWVVQEHVNIPALTVPVVINNKLDFEYKKFNFNMLVFSGKYAGGFVRLSKESVINVAKGGGILPCLAPDQFSEQLDV